MDKNSEGHVGCEMFDCHDSVFLMTTHEVIGMVLKCSLVSSGVLRNPFSMLAQHSTHTYVRRNLPKPIPNEPSLS